MKELKLLIEAKKKELESVRRRRFEIEKELEMKAKELEALKKIEQILAENPSLAKFIKIGGVVSGDKPEIKMG